MNLREWPGLTVEVSRVIHAPDIAGPPGHPHVFVYFITITNTADEAVTIKGRKWIVREATGQTAVIEGDGVVGEFPRLEPGEQFSYNSSHAVAADAVAEGAYLCLTDAGEAAFARIPKFGMRVGDD